MHVHRAHRARLLPAALLALVLAFGPSTAHAQGKQRTDTGRAARVDTAKTDSADAARTPAPGSHAAAQKSDSTDHGKAQPSLDEEPYGLPKSWISALWLAALFGMIGGFINDLLANAGKIEYPVWWSRKPAPEGGLQSTPGGIAFGFVADVLIGATAGVIAVVLKRPIVAWPAVVLIALAGGVAAKAILTNVGVLVKIQEANQRTAKVAEQGASEARLFGARLKPHVEAAGLQARAAGLQITTEDSVDAWVEEAIERIRNSAEFPPTKLSLK